MIPIKSTSLALGFALFCIFMGLYLSTYQGFPLSKDELFIFDSTESLVRRGDFYRTYEYGKYYDFSRGLGPDGEPFPPPNQEPLASILIAPLFWLGQSIPDIGIIHTVWLFNLFVTSLTAMSLYFLVIKLDYKPTIAILIALCYGMGTIAWVYSRTLFREPLMAFFTLWCFYFALMIQRYWRNQATESLGTPHIPYGLFAGLILSFIGAFLTKVVSILLIPGLLIVLIPPNLILKRQRRTLVQLLIVIGIIVIVAGVVAAIDNNTRARYSPQFWLNELQTIQWESVWESFLGYHLSFGRSLWLYNPILLLGFIGAFYQLKARQWRLIAATAVIVLITSASYGIAHRYSWWGGWGWGPRYMLPFLPLLSLWLAPLLEQMRRRWQWGLFFVVLTISASLQLLGMSVRLSNYYTDLTYRNQIAVQEWQWMDFNWTWRWSPFRYHLERFDLKHLDFAWLSAEPTWLAPFLGVMLFVSGIIWIVYVIARNPSRMWQWGFNSLVALALIVSIGLGLQSLRQDERYVSEWQDAFALIQTMNKTTMANEAVLLDREQYTLLAMNYFKPPVLFVTLPYAPGEVYSPNDPIPSYDYVDVTMLPPETQAWIETHSIDEYRLILQMGAETYYTINWIADRYPSLWLFASSNRYQPEKIRPIERYLSLYYFPVYGSEIDVSYRARAIRYLTIDVPRRDPTHQIQALFVRQKALDGLTLPTEQLLLTGLDLPLGTVFERGEIIPISLEWMPLTPLHEDYIVSVQLAMAEFVPNVPIVQHDDIPQASFGKMTTWQAGQPYRDNYGLVVPKDAPAGLYNMQIIVYLTDRLVVTRSLVVTVDNIVIGAELTIQ